MNILNLRARALIVKLIRQWFDDHVYLEIHTPRLVGLPGQEPHLEPFWTEVTVGAQFIAPSGVIHHAPTYPAALITSPEYAMKCLLAEGLDKIYDLGPCFRNGEPWDGTHDPEFLLLEWYRRNAGLEDLMRDTEEMIRHVGAQFVAPSGVMNHVPTLEQPFRRLTVEEAWREYAGIELSPLLEDHEAMAQTCRDHGQTVEENDTWDDSFFKIFLTLIEPKLGQEEPTFLHRYPLSLAALARPCTDDPRYAERVELYMGGLELANGFAELSDPVEQRKRFEEERVLRQKMGKATWPLDERFLSALPKMGNAAGIAFGVDRLVMLLAGAKSINEVLPFPVRERFERRDG